MKIYKVYAQCVRTINPITEIDLPKANDLIMEKVFDMLNNGDLIIDIDSDEQDEVNKVFDDLTSKAIEFFGANNFFLCGDFAVIRSEEYPTRSGSYGWTRDF